MATQSGPGTEWIMLGNRYPPVGLIVQKVDSAIHLINFYAMDKHYQDQLYCPLESDYPVDSIIHCLNNRILINQYPVDKR